LSKAIINPPIRDKFLTRGKISRGNKWKIIVVGTKNISNIVHANLILSEKIISTEPVINSIIADNNKSLAIGSGNPLLAINWNCPLKLVIFPGIAFIKIALKRNLPKKFNE